VSAYTPKKVNLHGTAQALRGRAPDSSRFCNEGWSPRQHCSTGSARRKPHQQAVRVEKSRCSDLPRRWHTCSALEFSLGIQLGAVSDRLDAHTCVSARKHRMSAIGQDADASAAFAPARARFRG